MILLLLLPMQNVMADGEVDIQSINVSATKSYHYKVDGSVSFKLSETLQKALAHGVKLNASIDFTLGQHRVWWWNSSRLISRISYQLKYHALTKHYVLKRKNSDQHWSFSTLPAALKQMGKIEKHPLPALTSVIDEGSYYLYVRAKVGVASQSLPLKIQSYFKSNKYHTKSEGVLWALP
ncbi:MAG: DUF4390 domain-containing protein [Thiotrichaceae bacterium]